MRWVALAYPPYKKANASFWNNPDETEEGPEPFRFLAAARAPWLPVQAAWLTVPSPG